MRRWIALVAFLTVGCGVQLAGRAGWAGTYGDVGTPNGGVFVGDCYHANAGLELWGPEGTRFFINEC